MKRRNKKVTQQGIPKPNYMYEEDHCNDFDLKFLDNMAENG